MVTGGGVWVVGTKGVTRVLGIRGSDHMMSAVVLGVVGVVGVAGGLAAGSEL